MTEVKPKHYKIHLEPDLQKFKFEGTVEILIEIKGSITEVSLNTHQLAIWSCEVEEEKKFIKVPFRLDPTRQELLLMLPKEMTGQIKLKIEYVGQINESLVGLYRSKYVVDNQEKYIAVTQFEEIHARQVFPCFDHPSKKATFDIEYIIDENIIGIANTPVLEEKALDDGRKLVKFETTPIMASYLLFFGIGEFEILEDASERVLHRVITTPGKAQYGNFGLELSKKVLQFGEDYTGVEYPLKKMDQIAVPDFAFGAMENYGAITYRENLLLVYPGITSTAGLERIAVVIAHEWAHQWFGNLVTPEDWKYVWLNESFATLFGFAITDHYYPEWRIWDQFLAETTKWAFERDSLIETVPIELPGEGDQIKLDASTAPIIYNKGGAILQMIRGYLGDENFQQGINYFLTKFKFNTASSEDYWQTFSEITDIPINQMMETWIYQPGYPIIETTKIGNKITLKQRRFSFISHEFDQVWVIPVTLAYFTSDGKTHSEKLLLKESTGSITIPDNVIAFKLNVKQTGFYRVLYQKENLQKLGELIVTKKLSLQDRYGLLNDLFAFVRSGTYSLDAYLIFLGNYKTEDAYLSLIEIASNLVYAYNVVESKREKIRAIGLQLFSQVLDQIGYEPKEEELHTTTILRSRILWASFKFGDEKAVAFGTKKFKQLLEGKTIHPDILEIVLRIGAASNSGTYDWFIKKLETPETGEQEKANILMALGEFRDQKTLQKALKYALKKVPRGNQYIPIVSAGNNLNAADQIWYWYLDHLKELEQIHSTHYERVIMSIVVLGGLGREKEVNDFFKRYMQEKDLAKDAIKIALERLEIDSRLRNA